MLAPSDFTGDMNRRIYEAILGLYAKKTPADIQTAWFEVKDFVTGRWSLIPLAGPANKQGRIVADNIGGKESIYVGTIGTTILRIFGLTVAATGVNEKTLKAGGEECKAIHLHPMFSLTFYQHPFTVCLLIVPIMPLLDGLLSSTSTFGSCGLFL